MRAGWSGLCEREYGWMRMDYVSFFSYLHKTFQTTQTSFSMKIDEGSWDQKFKWNLALVRKSGENSGPI